MIEIFGTILLILAVLTCFGGLSFMWYIIYSVIKDDITRNKYNKNYHEKTNT